MDNRGKINQTNQLGLNFNKEMRDFIIKHQYGVIEQYPGSEHLKELIDDMVSDLKNKNYFFTKSANAVCERINVDKFEPEFLNLSKKKYKKATLLINDKLFYRIIIREKDIYCMICDVRSTPMPVLFDGVQASPELQNKFFYTTFRIIPENNQINLPVGESFESEKIQKFLKYLIFFEFSEVEKRVLLPNQSMGTKREGKVRNESVRNLTVVDSLWNTFTVVDGKFTVSGHFRLQPVGAGRKSRKLIYIDEYAKDGYTRKSGKETEVQKTLF